ncbi:Alanine racemase [Candidatus Cyrtobacter comes]|uniref:Alanine racemase n=1 Tax=Candidatus Cyrtobacter comes TaxID=675776 RepID=A0ABU5L700_9RICK|nr:alanine racemase [Candidatus Cyrtobacter comes]MDZ5761901.1 Alanine racemase [Candidatus Cyrtobacter comes]
MDKYSGTTLTIDLNSIRKNYLIIKSKVAVSCAVSAVLKADAYGIGVKHVAPALELAGCNVIFVANIDEALEIQPLLNGSSSVYVLHGAHTKELIDLCNNRKIHLVLNNLEQVKLFNKFSHGINAILHIDTGMNRLGISELDLYHLISEGALPKVEYIMSHLSSSEVKEASSNRLQLDLINKYRAKLGGIKVSLANSAGIFLGEEYHFDMVRPGCALYGISHKICEVGLLEHSISLDAHIIQKRIIIEDQSVGYGGKYIAKAGSKLFTLDIGYADGYPRSLSNKGKAFIAGYLLDIVGVISMDSMVVDATVLPESIFNNATHVELIGRNISIDAVSLLAGASGYELIASKLGHRFKRVYIDVPQC